MRGITYDDAPKRRALGDHEGLLSFLAVGSHILGIRHLSKGKERVGYVQYEILSSQGYGISVRGNC